MLATVPTRESSSGPGFSVSGLRWKRTPSGRFAFAAAWAAAIEASRPSAIGRIMPGKSTILRTGRMMSASSGSATVPLGADRGAAALAFSPGGFRSLPSSSRFIPSPHPSQIEGQAAVRKAPIDELELAGGQRDAALEAPIGNFQPVNDGALIFHGKSAFAANDDAPGFEEDLEFTRRDAWERDAEREPVRRLVEVDGRLPARRFSRADLEEPALQPLRASEQLQCFGPHP